MMISTLTSIDSSIICRPVGVESIKRWRRFGCGITWMPSFPLASQTLVDRILGVGRHQDSSIADDVSKLDRHQRRDLLLLTAFYDHSTAEQMASRWQRLRRKLRFLVDQSSFAFRRRGFRFSNHHHCLFWVDDWLDG